jgi:prevent-host-death family protein
MVKKINALKARRQLGQLLEGVYYKNDQYIIERAGRPMAAVVPVWQFEEREKHKKRFFGMVKELWEKNKQVKPEVIEQEVAEAIRAVRAKRTRSKA